jgi:hypothetical protein
MVFVTETREDSTMSEGRAQILEMLVSGRVTMEQADRLLEALEGPSTAAPNEPANQMGRRQRREESTNNAFASLTPKQLIALRDHGVDRAFIEQMRAAGVEDLGVDDFIELYDHGVDAEFVRELGEMGFTNLTRDQLIELYEHGVDAEFVREMRGLGFNNLTPGEWVTLRDEGAETAENDETGE